tara:strand:- start:649 stop:891 length:243 start_codon:yes stop_codon:yes gene_type:complete
MTSNSTAKTSLILAIISWLPLFNFITAPSSIYFGIKALQKIKNNPDKYSGKVYAIIGLSIGCLITVFSYSWLLFKIIGQI